MGASPPPAVSSTLVSDLLQQPTTEAQAAYLREAGQLNRATLSDLLDQAMRLARSDPGRARQVARLCAALAQPAGAPAIWPRATYVQAQTHAINGEFEQAHDLIQSARQAYEELGERLEALRTNIGLMHVLNESGRHQAALQAGQAVLDGLRAPEAQEPRARLLAALAHQNRGVCFETIGRYDDALTAYTLAASLFAELEQTERLGDIHNNRGIVLVHLGRVSEALAAFEAAARIWAEAGLRLLHGQTLSNLGDAHLALGQYARSLEVYEEARQLLEPLDAEAHRYILLRKMADAHLALNLYPEAQLTYREATGALKAAGMTDHYARAAWGLGAALLAEGDRWAAAEPLEEARRLFAAAENAPMQCTVMLEQAALRQARGETSAALELARAALNLVAAEPGGEGRPAKWPVQAAYAALRAADLLLPDTQAAEPYLEAAQAYAGQLALPAISYRLHSRLGRLRRLQGQTEAARTHLETAVAQAETLRGHLVQEALRTSFLRDKTAAYDELIRLHLDQQPSADDSASAAAAFAVADRAKSRTLVDLLTGVIAPSAPDPAVDADGAAEASAAIRLRDLEADLNAIYNRFLSGDHSSDAGEARLPELQARAVAVEREISRLRLRLGGNGRLGQRAHAALDPLTGAMTVEWGDPLGSGDALPPDLTVIAYHSLDDEIVAFVRRGSRLRVARAVSRNSAVKQLLEKLEVQWDRFRAGQAFAQRHMAAMAQATQRVLAELYAAVFAPLEPLLEAVGAGERLAIVPHGLLHQVPFHALYGREAYLLDRFEIAYAPSATVLALCEQRARQQPRRALVMGLADALIPSVTGEVHAVADALTRAGLAAHVAEGARATAAVFGEQAPGCDVVHLACHGLFRADNPMFSALRLHAGWLTAAAVMTHPLAGACVALSACESGRGRVLGGDEVLGLPRAFLGAGAACVLVSLWLAQDETTAALLADWYTRWVGPRGTGPAAALRAAQQALREQYAHPFYWAPFVVIGQR